MFFRPIAVICGLAAASAALASVTISVDRLDPTDGGNQPPAGVVCVDIFVHVTPGDTWTSGGIRALAQNGATLRYATDPNTGANRLTNPGTNNRFVSFFSKPRARDANNRYANGSATSTGRYSPSGPIATAGPTEVNVAWTASPPETVDSPTVDGYVFRLAINYS